MDVAGTTPSVPQWSSIGSALAFQSLQSGQRAIQFFDLVAGYAEIVTLYDPTERWLAYPALAPKPYSGKIVFSGKRSGFYDLYEVEYSRGQNPRPVPLTNNLEMEKKPRWCLINGELYLFYISGNDLYYQKYGEKTRLLVRAADRECSEITDFAVQSDPQGIVRLALCTRAGADIAESIYCGELELRDGELNLGKIRKVSDLIGKYFAPAWTSDTAWLICYLEDSDCKVRLIRIEPERGGATILSEGEILIPPTPEMRFKGPQIVGTPPKVLYFLKKPEYTYPVLTLTSIEDPHRSWEFKDQKYLHYFRESSDLSLSPDHNFLAWTFMTEQGVRKLAIALVNLSALEEE